MIKTTESLRNCFLCVLWITLILRSAAADSRKEYILQRQKRSIKDALPKDDDFSQSRAITGLRQKIFSLESSMKTMNTEIDKIVAQNQKFEKSTADQKGLLENLENQFTSLQHVLSTHAESLADLEKISSTSENLFALSNQTCGGVLVGQTGSIVLSNSAALRGTRHPSSCIWTVRANNRQTIKISTHFSFRSTYSYSSRSSVYVVEIIKNVGNNTTDSPISTRVTKLEKNMHHIFDGPILFVVYALGTQSSDDYADVDLHLQFEGLGKLTEKSTYFSHEALFQNSGNFSNTNLASWGPSILDQLPENSSFILDYTTLVISNFSTKVHLQAAFENGRCPDGVSFIVITDMLENTTDAKDCCRSNCEGRNSLINYDNPYLIIITKKFQQPLKFNLTWLAETPYPSSSKPASSYGHKCGEVLGGVSGTLSYKPHISYRNGERCIWAIVPQPRPRSSIVLNVGTNGVENTYDHLYMMELTDASGTALANGPKVTRLGRYGSYEAHSRELYIVFYSDSSVTGYGFSISWRSSGSVVKTGEDVTSSFTILRDDQGSATSLELKPPQTNDVYQVFLLTPVVPYSYIFGMQLLINQTYPVPQPNQCLHEDITVFTALDGILNRTQISNCPDPGQTVIEHADGMAMIVLNKQDTKSNVSMNFSWKEEYGEGNSSYVVVENGNCGGVIRGDSGVLKYKIGVDYFNNERCVWLLHSPNSTNITLKLVKDGFETCCDYLLVTTIEPTNGTLRNDTVPMNRSNRTRTFEDSVLVIVFRSDASTRGRGFALQFTANGERGESSLYRYQLHHHNEPFGGVAYPSSEWLDPIPGIQDIIVIASSLKVGLDEDPLMMPSNISWTSGVFKKDSESCTYDSITFYTTPDPDGWLKRESYPHENDTSTCTDEIQIPKKNNICSTVFSAFLVVYKPVSIEVEEDEEDVMRMGFTFKKSAGCGGVIVGESGEISYKEDGRYANLEKCIWLVEAPQASKIRFRLERSGFEECCDILVINTIHRLTGIPHKASVISQGNRTTIVDGPLAAVVFSTDSSVAGEGFRLTFQTFQTTEEDFPFTYHLEHGNQPTDNSFVYLVQPSQMIIIAYSPEIHRQTYLGTGKTQLNIQSMRPQIDEYCNSDRLSVYDVLGRDRELILAKSFSIVDVTKSELPYSSQPHPNCTALQDRDFTPCENILECGDAPANGVFYANTTSFLAVYRSVNTTGTLRFRGFVMVSSTTFANS